MRGFFLPIFGHLGYEGLSWCCFGGVCQGSGPYRTIVDAWLMNRRMVYE